jgi:hypothetical protein
MRQDVERVPAVQANIAGESAGFCGVESHVPASMAPSISLFLARQSFTPTEGLSSGYVTQSCSRNVGGGSRDWNSSCVPGASYMTTTESRFDREVTGGYMRYVPPGRIYELHLVSSSQETGFARTEKIGLVTKFSVDARAQYGTLFSTLSRNGSTKEPLNGPAPANTSKGGPWSYAVTAEVSS